MDSTPTGTAEGRPGVPTLVLVDDAVEVRTLVRARLRLAGGIEVVAEGGTGHEAVRLAEERQPDLMLLDVSMPGMDGLEALPRIRAVSPETRIVMYSGFVEEGLAERTLARGAHAFYEKSSSLDSLPADLLRLLDGDAQPAPAPDEVAEPAPALGQDWVSETTVEPVLREHLERFREVFEDAAIGMATMTLAGRVVRANPSLARLTGRTVAELVAVPYADLMGGEGDDERFARALEQTTSGLRDAVQLEHPVAERPDRLLLATLSPVRDAAQRPLYLFLQVQDVSQQREVEEELRLSEQRFRLLVEAVQDYAIFMLDPDGCVASWNAGAQRIKGWTESEIVGHHFRTFYPRDKQLERHPEHELELAVRDGRYEEEGWRVRKDGSTFWAQVTITAVRDAGGELVGFAKVTRDATERRMMLREQEDSARALAAANAQLQQVAEDQAHFLALTAHELRSPVGALGGTARLLQEHWTELPEVERKDLLEAMAAGAGRLERLLGDLLTASRIRGSSIDVRLDELDLAEQLHRRLEASEAAVGADVVVDVAAGLRVRADRDRLAQVVDNLIRNALHHGAVPVVLTAETREDAVDLVVRDAGGGVPGGLQERLFERFATGSDGGTGLGLYIVRVLARAQGGDARYRPDDGAFVVTLQHAERSES